MWIGLRRGMLILLLATAVAPSQTLKQSAEHAHVLIGTAVRPGLLSESRYAATLAREFTMVEPEDAMKWYVARREAGKFDFSGSDAIVAFAAAHGMKVRGHCLVWDHNHPDWLATGHFTPAQLRLHLQTHITTEMAHYAGQVFAWDVVNEAFDENGHLKDSIWYNQPGIGLAEKGTGYIEQAFRWAHEADPQALLFYNDNGGEGLGVKADAIYAMAKDFRQRGVPIHGVGLQMHISTKEPDFPAIAANLVRLTALGLQVHITEMDVSLALDANGNVAPDALQQQAEIYRRIVQTCLQNTGCTAIQTWGFTDRYSWIGSHTHGARGAALLFDREYHPKPSYYAILQELSAASGFRK